MPGVPADCCSLVAARGCAGASRARSLLAQAAVENYYVDLGVLTPVYDPIYWFGLNTSDGSTWNQLDRTISNTFKGWGVFKPGPGQQPTREPNNLFDPEYCAGCNYTELVTGKFSAWGWGDEQCGQLHPVMCRSTGAYLMALAAAAC